MLWASVVPKAWAIEQNGNEGSRGGVRKRGRKLFFLKIRVYRPSRSDETCCGIDICAGGSR